MWLGDKSSGLMVRLATQSGKWDSEVNSQSMEKFFQETGWGAEYILLTESDGQPWSYGDVTEDGLFRRFLWDGEAPIEKVTAEPQWEPSPGLRLSREEADRLAKK